MKRVAALAVGALLVPAAACSSGSSHATGTTGTTTTAATGRTRPAGPATTAPAGPDRQVWLCRPGAAPDPCLSPLTATVDGPGGSSTVQRAEPAAHPDVDCFYVYPTVSNQPTVNANLRIDAAEVGVAIAQASRYSQVCRVFAPMYRQVTIFGLFSRNAHSRAIAYDDVVSAWNDYLARYNDGRGVVLIGHSQGAFVLKQLIARHVDGDAALRRRIVSAILLGGNVVVPEGKDVGGDFRHLPACRAPAQTGCVIAFSSFDHPPPANSFFGLAPKAGEQILCTNPAALAGGTGAIVPYLPSQRVGGPISFTKVRLAPTPWVSYPGLFTAHCEHTPRATWLQVDDVREPGDTRPVLRDALGPTWGLHVYDGNIALGNLVDVVRAQARAYLSAG